MMMAPDVDPRILPDMMVLLEVVRAGSLTKAAKKLHTVQSNVTARIKVLETAVGVPLLQRHARGIRPTPAGEAALAMAVRMDAVLDDLRVTFGNGAATTVAKLRLGAIETVAASHLPAVVADFVRAHPHVDVAVQTASSATLLKRMKDGELDVVFVSRKPGVPGFREQVAWHDELVLVVPSAVASMAGALASDAGPSKILVQRLGCSYTERLLALLTARDRPYRLLELGTLEGILGFVEAGVGIAVMPRTFVETLATARKLRLLPLPRNVRRLTTHLVAPARGDASQVVNEFIATCERPVSPPRRRPRRAARAR